MCGSFVLLGLRVLRLQRLPHVRRHEVGHIIPERGYFADVVVFDPKEVNSPASYENPAVPPVGIRHVLRNGAMV